MVGVQRISKGVNILSLNCGSSSLKYKLIRMPEEEELISGEVQRLGVKTDKGSLVIHNSRSGAERIKKYFSTHSEAFSEVLKLIIRDKRCKIDIFAHRYVHPGNIFSDTTKITTTVLKKLEQTLELAPIHNPISFQLIESCNRSFKNIPQYLVFDTSFHSTIPRHLSHYALPLKLSNKFGLKKIGFHGISHKYVMEESCKFLKRPVKTQKIISVHLGTGGASVTAIDRGRSINNSMGFTPLEGLIMNTRCGDMDAGLIFYLMFKDKCSLEKIGSILNRESGILGLSGKSSDIRDIIEKIDSDSQAKIVFDIYIRRIKKYIGFYSLLLKKADVLIFTDSIGVESALVRKKIVEGFEFMGLKIKEKENRCYLKGIADISSVGSQTKTLIVPTDEELMIAREVFKKL